MAPRLVLGALCVVYIVGSVLAVEAKGFPTLASQLRGAKGSVSTASHHDEYEESKYYSSNSICLREVKRTGCAYETGNGFDPAARKAGGIIGGPTPTTDPADMQTTMFTSDVACCNDKDDYDNYGKKGMFIEQKGMYSPAVGNCDFVNFIREDPIDVLAGVTAKVGNAQITCSFFDGAEKCDSDLCDGTTFTVQATIYDIAAYSHTPGFSGTGGAGILQAPSGIGCPVIPGFYDPLFGQRSAGKKVETASYDEYRNPYYEEYSRIPETLYYGNAVIYVGSITSVQSPKHEKFIGGKFEMVADWDGKVPTATVTDYRATWINGPGVAVELDKLGKY